MGDRLSAGARRKANYLLGNFGVILCDHGGIIVISGVLSSHLVLNQWTNIYASVLGAW